MRLIAACHVVRFYDEVVTDDTSNDIRWGKTIENFQYQRKVLKERKKEGIAYISTISKALAIIKSS